MGMMDSETVQEYKYPCWGKQI